MQNLRDMQIFPMQVGPPTPYARSRSNHLLLLLLFQVLMTVAAIGEYLMWATGIIMVLGILLGLYAYKEHMNITYITWWGFFCFAAAITAVITGLFSIAIRISTITMKFLIPVSCLLGSLLAWFLYEDYEMQHPTTDLIGQMLIRIGLLRKDPFGNPLLQGGDPYGQGGPQGYGQGPQQYGPPPQYGTQQQYGPPPNNGYGNGYKDYGTQSGSGGLFGSWQNPFATGQGKAAAAAGAGYAAAGAGYNQANDKYQQYSNQAGNRWASARNQMNQQGQQWQQQGQQWQQQGQQWQQQGQQQYQDARQSGGGFLSNLFGGGGGGGGFPPPQGGGQGPYANGPGSGPFGSY